MVCQMWRTVYVSVTAGQHLIIKDNPPPRDFTVIAAFIRLISMALTVNINCFIEHNPTIQLLSRAYFILSGALHHALVLRQKWMPKEAFT